MMRLWSNAEWGRQSDGLHSKTFLGHATFLYQLISFNCKKVSLEDDMGSPETQA